MHMKFKPHINYQFAIKLTSKPVLGREKICVIEKFKYPFFPLRILKQQHKE